MSRVDSHLPQELFDAMIAEVRSYLPAHLAALARVHHQPLQDVSELLRLTKADVRRLLAIHACLSEPVRDFVAALPDGLRHLPPSSARTTVETRAVRGAIDWGGTTRRRALAGNDRSVFATRPAVRDHDTAENRVLAWLIDETARTLRIAAGRWSGHEPGKRDEDGQLRADLVAMTAHVARARKLSALESLDAPRPTVAAVRALGASRQGFFRHHVAPAAALLLRVDDPVPEVITEILCQRFFEPDTAWHLYELVIALRLARAFDAADGLVPRPRRLLRGSTDPGAYASYRLPDGGTVELTFQGWPKDGVASMRAQTATAHGLKTRASIPDVLMIRRATDKSVVDVVVLELKATLEGGYLAQGLSQLLGYLGERPDLLARRPAAWLVAPDGAFTAADADGASPLWMVGAQEVGGHAVTRMTAG